MEGPGPSEAPRAACSVHTQRRRQNAAVPLKERLMLADWLALSEILCQSNHVTPS